MASADRVRQGGVRGDPDRSGPPGDVRQADRRVLRRRRPRCSSWPPSRCRTPGWCSSPRTTSPSMTAIEKSIRDSDLGVNPTNDGNIIRVTPAAADRGAAQGVHQARPAQGRGRPDLDPRPPAERPRTRWTRWSRTRRSARTRSSAPRSSSTPVDQEAHRPDRRRPEAQGSRAPRGLGRQVEPEVAERQRGRSPARPQVQPRRRVVGHSSGRAGPGRAGRNLPAAIGIGVGARARTSSSA